MGLAVTPTLYWIADVPAGRLAIVPRPRGGDWLDDEVRAWRAADVEVVVSLLTRAEVQEWALHDEAPLCRENGIEYLSFPIADRGVPRFAEQFGDLVKTVGARLSEGKAVAVHCRAGIGRSSLLAVSVLASLGVDAETAWERVRTARGCPVPDTPEQRAWVNAFARTLYPVAPAI